MITFAFHDYSKRSAIHVEDAFDFASQIHEMGENPPTTATGALWLRGQSDESWDLMPSIGRTNKVWLGLWLRRPATGKKARTEIARMKKIEYHLMHRFRRQAHAFLKREPNQWETITMAQHYGLPTRLLDWTSNPLVALYFACQSHENTDGAVFSFRPSKRSSYHLNVYDDKSPSHIYEPTPLAVKGVRIIYPMMSSQRLVAQSGAFTLQDPWTPLNEQAGTMFPASAVEITDLYKWLIPQKHKVRIVSQLHRAGINHKSLFPDLSGVAVGMLRAELLRKHGPF
jgi:hypothetical protein